MSFERFVCWDPGRVEQVMRIDADAAQAPTFMAVHTEESLSFERPAGRRPAREFLADFLAAPGDVRAVVIGDSGSGKSHLVRWVGLNIPRERTDLRMVTVPRSGTSLRWIVRRLIDELPSDLQGDYLAKLVHTPDTPSDAKALGFRLLNALAEDLDRLEPKNEVDAHLAAGLRDFFTDPAMREHHAGESGIVPDLVRHITGASGREERNTRRRFEEADLHLDDVLTHLDDFAKPTTTLLRTLQANPEFRQRSIELVNAQLDPAVAQTLGIGSGELTELLNGIRRHLANRGETLVLLIEDFVRTEGIDRALLDALIESRDELCRLKLLIAVTTGYYRGGVARHSEDPPRLHHQPRREGTPRRGRSTRPVRRPLSQRSQERRPRPGAVVRGPPRRRSGVSPPQPLLGLQIPGTVPRGLRIATDRERG